MSNKDPKSKKSFADRIKDSGKEFIDGVKEEVQEARKASSTESTTSYIQQKKQSFQQTVVQKRFSWLDINPEHITNQGNFFPEPDHFLRCQ